MNTRVASAGTQGVVKGSAPACACGGAGKLTLKPEETLACSYQEAHSRDKSSCSTPKQRQCNFVYAAAQNPLESGRIRALLADASENWCRGSLRQRRKPRSAPQIIAILAEASGDTG